MEQKSWILEGITMYSISFYQSTYFTYVNKQNKKKYILFKEKMKNAKFLLKIKLEIKKNI